MRTPITPSRLLTSASPAVYDCKMGIIKHPSSGRRITLGTRSLVGRARWCVVRVASRRASGEHAVLQWDGTRWAVRDLGSTNGTNVGGRRLASNERASLKCGAVLVFGGDDEHWILEEDGPPTASARAEAIHSQWGQIRGIGHKIKSMNKEMKYAQSVNLATRRSIGRGGGWVFLD